MDILSNFGETLKFLISDENIDAEILAKAVNIDRSVIYKYLRKECLPNLPNFILIADYFQCSADYLLGLSDNNIKAPFKKARPFSQSFKQLLSDKHLNRTQFRKEIHFARQSVDDWYNGKRNPTVDNIITIAKHFGYTIDCLLGRE